MLNQLPKKKLISTLTVLVWLGACAWSFWWFSLRYVTNFDDYYVNFDGTSFSDIRMLPSDIPARLMHFIDEACPCSHFAKAHIDQLQSEFKQLSQHYFWPDFPPELKNAFPVGPVVPASPAVAVWDAEGQLAYFGPYSSGAICGSGTDFVSITISKLTKQLNPHWVNHDVVGCYCPWRDK